MKYKLQKAVLAVLAYYYSALNAIAGPEDHVDGILWMMMVVVQCHLLVSSLVVL